PRRVRQLRSASHGSARRPTRLRSTTSYYRRSIVQRILRRRQLLMGLSLVAIACGRITQKVVPTLTPSLPPELNTWREEIRGMLADALAALRTSDVLAAYRTAFTPGSSLRLPAGLAWDPPTGKAWNAATHVSQGLYGRADQLLGAVTTASIDPTLWR